MRPPGTAADGPPRARLAFRVGIIGHRPNRLPTDRERLESLRRTIQTILSDVRETLLSAGPEASLYNGGAPILRAISPLAEGSDRIFAEAALAQGYELCCPMPFFQEEFEKDFVAPSGLETDSLSHFHAILERARANQGLTKFEMDGERQHAPEAYGAAGRIVLNQTDLLIAVWDGGEPAGLGGTVYTLHEALKYQVPVIWVDALAPAAWRVLHTAADLVGKPGSALETPPRREQLREAVAGIVRAEFCLPPHNPSEMGSHACDYFAERKPWLNPGLPWRIFWRLLVDGKLSSPFVSDKSITEQIHTEWSTAANSGTPPSPLEDWINSRLRDHFAWADRLANFYADAHRSAFVASYLLAATAVLVALLPMTLAWGRGFEIACTGIEFVILATILALLKLGRARHWHERWTDYRLLAELIRQLRFLIPLGGGRPLPRIPAHLAVYGDPARTWMYWHVRAIAREVGIPDAQVTPVYMHDCLDFLTRLAGDEHSGQCNFHLMSERRARLLSQRLRSITLFLLAFTIGSVFFRLLYFAVPKEMISGALEHWLILTSATLPALGAALEGINNQGEFTRIAKRSAAMASGFKRYAEKIASLKKSLSPRLASVIPLSSDIAETMVAEVVDWRAIFIDRSQ